MRNARFFSQYGFLAILLADLLFWMFLAWLAFPGSHRMIEYGAFLFGLVVTMLGMIAEAGRLLLAYTAIR